MKLRLVVAMLLASVLSACGPDAKERLQDTAGALNPDIAMKQTIGALVS
ncbi:MAG TPA: hypothetical protein VMS82_14755 [Pseudolabrys sp.]|nr:hypothetical protein [Pseudolabrys sp.]